MIYASVYQRRTLILGVYTKYRWGTYPVYWQCVCFKAKWSKSYLGIHRWTGVGVGYVTSILAIRIQYAPSQQYCTYV